jgi:hypothetical protein
MDLLPRVPSQAPSRDVGPLRLDTGCQFSTHAVCRRTVPRLRFNSENTGNMPPGEEGEIVASNLLGKSKPGAMKCKLSAYAIKKEVTQRSDEKEARRPL